MTEVRTTLDLLRKALHGIARFYPATADPPRVAQSQTRTAPGSKPPIPAAVLSLRREAAEGLSSWVLLIAEERDLRPGMAGHDVPALVRFLEIHAVYLAGHEAGEEALREIARFANQLEKVATAYRPEQRFVGPCRNCGADLYAQPAAVEIRCRECRYPEDVEERRSFLRGAAEDRLLTAAEVSRAVPGLAGEPVNQTRIAMWKSRGRISPHGKDGEGRDLFRVGDVLDLLNETKRRAG